MGSYNNPLTLFSSYLTLNSGSSQHFYPHNLGNNFTNHLVKPIENTGNELEIALVDAYFKLKDKKKDNSIFGHLENDNRISITRRSAAIHTVLNKPGFIENFVEFLNQAFERRGINIKFHTIVTEDEKEFLKLIFTQPGYRINISKNYARAFGFFKDDYPSGEIIAENPISQELFDIIDINESLKFTIFQDEVSYVYIKEPKYKDVLSLINEINKSLKDYQVFFSWNENFVYTYLGNADLFVSLPNYVEEIFGVPLNSVFSGSEMEFPTFENIIFKTSEYNIITCNIIEDQEFRGKTVPVLKAFRQNNTHAQSISCDPLQYIPINTKSIEHIRIQLFDETLERLIIDPMVETIVTVHIKSRF